MTYPNDPMVAINLQDDNETHHAPILTSSLLKPSEVRVNTKTSTFARVDVTVAGTPHKITCPEDEIENVQKTAHRLHENIISLRQQVKNKNPSNEELLVIHCLELYDQISELKTTQKFAHDKEQRATALIDQLLKTAKAIAK